ncbi:hypothetical protein [Pseudomonas sp. D(2018)]|uniref:hypothetical protein n=1 Tax=Pseudomonas sp. D(2018) TaxID=2502238 RepID=UPI0010F97367|nr:hypothetical protein [Pseudomonas sp. D(2018)]
MNTLQLRLFQVTPSERLLDQPARPAATALLDSSLIEDIGTRQRVAESRTVRELFMCFTPGTKDGNRRLTQAMHHVLATLETPIAWDAIQRGIRVSDYAELVSGTYRNFQSARFAKVSADHAADGKLIFNVAVRNQGLFSERLAVADIIEDLLQVSGSRPLHLPGFDQLRNHSCVITGFSRKPLYYHLEGSQERWADFFVRHGRLAPAEIERRMASYEAGHKADAEIPIAWCRHGRSGKTYAYPAGDLALTASTALQGFVEDRRSKRLPAQLEEAGDLCAAGFKTIRAGMEDKSLVFDALESALQEWFTPAPPRSARYIELNYEQSRDLRRKAKYSLKTQVASSAELAELNRQNVLLYPIDGTSEQSKKVFLGFFNGGQAAKLGLNFEVLDYHQQIAVEQPLTLVQRIIETVGPGANVVMAWRRRSNGQLANNRMIEFEFMRHGIAVQHVVDEGQRGNANKVGHLLQGMREKFALHPPRALQSDMPFDLALGLDVSRYGGLDIPAFPVMVDKHGQATLHMPETFERGIKERRSTNELITALDNATCGRPLKVLFLRDGYAYEDYDAIAAALPHLELTVLSLRKNLLGAFATDMPTGELYALYADHDANRFVFGVNARLGEMARVNSVHMVEIVRNPSAYDKEMLGNVLIELSQQNRSSELEIASLPFPIAYADRSAWVIRDMMQDRQLRKYVRIHYPNAVNALGDEGIYIYSLIREYVLNRSNGYAFAV